MSNLFMLPFQDTEKVAGSGPNPYIEVLVSGDPAALDSIMSDEDRAFFKLSEATMFKLASGEPFSQRDINSLSNDEIAAITLLGERDAPVKVAAYLEFYNELAAQERSGRALAQQEFMQEKSAQDTYAHALHKIATDHTFAAILAKKASQELQRRRR